jgi:hypothetical protein
MRRRLPRASVAVAVGLVASALLWSAVAVPVLVKYPTDLDVTPRYDGSFTLFVDPTTAAPLAAPRELPLEIERHIRSIGAASGSSRVVVEETIKEKAGDLIDTTQTNVYVMNRRTMQNVADSRAYAFHPSNVVDRSGAYRLNLPFDTPSDATYPIYKNEIATTYEMRMNMRTPTTDEAGLHLRNFTGSASEVPLDGAYLAELNKVVTLPVSMTLDELKPQLKAFGLDIDAALAAVAPVITPHDFATLSQIAAKPIPLQYVLSFDGTAAVETTTGAEVDVRAFEWVGVKPVLADVTTLRAIIAHYPHVPEAVAAGDALAALSSAPATKLFEYRYQQTPASVVDIAGEVRALRNEIRLAEIYVPSALWGAATLSLAVGAFLYWRGRGRAIGVRTAAPAPERARERETASSGVSR